MIRDKEKYMKLAIMLAKKGIAKTNPNPPVGAVIVKNNKIIGKGYHKKYKGMHAEITALKKAGKNAYGSDLYVTLEPCSTYGQTPPCVNSIIKSGIKRVFIGSIDPNKKNKNKSFNIFKQADIKTEYNILKKETDELIKPFNIFINKKRPYYILKTAISLDGKISSYSGDSKWISSEKSRQFVHKLRNTVDAIIIGKNTLISDNPYLNVRGISNPKVPVKIILGYDESINEKLNIFEGQGQKIFFIKKEKKINNKIKNIEIIKIQDLKDLSLKLYERNIMSVLIEGGSSVYTSFIKEKLIDKFYFFIAPIILGAGKPVFSMDFKGQETIKKSLRLKNVEIKRFDNDMLVIGDK